MVAESFPIVSANHLPARFFSARITFAIFVYFIHICKSINKIHKNGELSKISLLGKVNT